jgi:hypothetical protein
MFFHADSHRASNKVDSALGRHPKHYYRNDNQKSGIYFCLDDPEEIEKALAVGAKLCRDQKPEGYLQCW